VEVVTASEAAQTEAVGVVAALVSYRPSRSLRL